MTKKDTIGKVLELAARESVEERATSIEWD